MLPLNDRIPILDKFCSIFLGPPAIAKNAWLNLATSNLLKSLTPDELKVLSQIIPLLTKQGIEDPQLEFIQKLFSSPQYKTKQIHHHFLDTLKVFPATKSAPLLLKGAALWKLFPDHCEARQMSDLDLLVPLEEREEWVEHFQKQGWKLEHDYRYLKYNWNHAFSFRTPHGLSVDLHWYLLKEDMRPETVNAFFKSASTHTERGITYKIPSPEHLFYHLVIHGCRLNSGSGVQWIIDSLLVLKNTPEFNWETVVKLAQRAKLLKSLFLSLEVLKRLEVTVPTEIIALLSNHQPNRYESIQLKLSQIPCVDFSKLSFLSILKNYMEFYILWHNRFILQKKWLSPLDFMRYYASSPTNLGAIKKIFRFVLRWTRCRLGLSNSEPVSFNRSY